jgi:hypothetical protein
MSDTTAQPESTEAEGVEEARQWVDPTREHFERSEQDIKDSDAADAEAERAERQQAVIDGTDNPVEAQTSQPKAEPSK